MLRSTSESSEVLIKEIHADSSGRSFLVQAPGGEVSYFWCSEKSDIRGAQLLSKMKDLLERKPSLAKLTGISESRLECFAVHLHAYLVGSSMSGAKASTTVDESTFLFSSASDDSPELHSNTLVSSLSSNCSDVIRAHSDNQSTRYQRSGHFDSSSENGLHGDNSCSFSVVDDLLVFSSTTITVIPTSQTEKKQSEASLPIPPLSPLGFLESLGTFTPSNPLSQKLPFSSQVSSPGSTLFSPYWSPPSTSTLQYTVTPPHLPISLPDSLSLPPLSSLLSAVRSSSSPPIPPMPPLNLANFPSLDFPAFMPDPMVHVSLPVSSFLPGHSSQQIPTFTPLICDSIVHIPVLEVCSSGSQGYLVSAGPSISTSIIPPLHPSIVNPLMPQGESVVEKGARETLRLLLASTQVVNNQQLMIQQVLPASILTLTEENHPSTSKLAVGSCSLYSGTIDADAIISNSVIPMVSLPNVATTFAGGVMKNKQENGDDSEIEPAGGGRSCFLDDDDDD